MNLTGMEELLETAKREGKWLHCTYQDLWFSPQELEEAQANGRLRWGVINWRLREPLEYLEFLKRKAQAAADDIVSFKKRMEVCK